MGTWDPTSFGNDTANDWAYDLEECHDLSYIAATMQKVIDVQDQRLSARASEEAIAAVEVVAWLRGKPSALNAYTKKVAAWVEAHPLQLTSAIEQHALTVMDRIRQPPSELLELWGDDERWTAAMLDLRRRLTS